MSVIVSPLEARELLATVVAEFLQHLGHWATWQTTHRTIQLRKALVWMPTSF
jgi:hypothetical protein